MEDLPLGPGEFPRSEIKHAMDSERQPICGEQDSYFGWDTVDRVIGKFITCPDCLNLIAAAVIDKLRRLGTALREEAHYCSQSIHLQSKLSRAEISLVDMRQQIDKLTEELKKQSKAVSKPLVAESSTAPKEVKKLEEKPEDDASTARFKLLEID